MSPIIKLSTENFNKARGYLMKHGRELEKELFRFHFEEGPANKILSILEEYQGAEGGFCNMGEGDSNVSNAMDTTMAFQVISEIGASSSEEIVRNGIKYIIDSYDQKIQCWHPNPTSRNDNWLDNPGAELVGYLNEYRELVPYSFLEIVSKHAIASMSTIQTTTESKQFYFFSALCLLRMAIRIDEPNKSFILKQLENDIVQIIEMDSSKWATTYCAKPFFFAGTPNSPLFPRIKKYVIQSLENEIKTQSADGNFILNWNVNGKGARVWKSIWTMDVLKTLNHHQMIEKE